MIVNIPGEWIAAIGIAFAGALGLLWRYFSGHLDRHTEAQKEEIARLRDKQDMCESTTLDLTGRVSQLEGEREGFLAGVEHVGNKFIRDGVDAIVERLETKE